MITPTDIYRARINKVIDHIQAHLHERISLDKLAEVACYSPYHFHRVFQAVTGEALNQFIVRARCERAARLLKFSKQPISAISIDCGFSSASTLTRAFNQYFHISPGAYRKGGEIQNSKIGKDFFPVHQYNCNREFEVEVRRVAAKRIAYIRVTNAFKPGLVLKGLEDLSRWARSVGLFGSQMIFGMSMDDPEVTPKGKYRYDVCITLPDNFKLAKEAPVSAGTLDGCKYAVTRVSGDMQLVGEAFNYLFDKWLISSGYECEIQPGIEVYLDKENLCNWEHFELELMIPIKAMI